jgi:hypothetical protein
LPAASSATTLTPSAGAWVIPVVTVPVICPDMVSAASMPDVVDPAVRVSGVGASCPVASL